MKILVLTSRYTATRDIIGENFGRQTRLFSAMKKLGHEIDFLVADYRKHENKGLKLNGINVMIRPFGLRHFFSFTNNLDSALGKKYDYLVASGDPLWGVIGYHYAKKHKIKFVYDLHDNYKTYMTYYFLAFGILDNYAIKKADVVTTVSYSLKEKISNLRKNVFAIQNGVDLSLFRPMDRKICRKELKLPSNAKIIAYAGSIQKLQGIDILVEAFNESRKENKGLFLVIAGRYYPGEENRINLKHEGIIYLGSLPQEKVPKLVNAADVVVVPNPANEFTKYCFPYKVVEYMACNVPIVATDVGDVGLLLKDFPGSLCRENDKDDMKSKIEIQLGKERVSYRKKAITNSWENIAKKFEKALKSG